MIAVYSPNMFGRDANCKQFHLENQDGRDSVGNLVVDGRITTFFFLREWDVGKWSGFMWLRIGAALRL
jgi:hypothetical protein